MMKHTLFACGVLLMSSQLALAQTVPPQLQLGAQFEERTINKRTERETDHRTIRFAGMENGFYRFDVQSRNGRYSMYRDEQFNPIRWINQSVGTKEVREFFRWPMTVGEQHGFKVSTSNGTVFDMTVTVNAEESVTTPAGTFQALRQTFSGTWSKNGQSGQRLIVDWYVPAIGWTVKSEYKDYKPDGELENWTVDELVTASRP